MGQLASCQLASERAALPQAALAGLAAPRLLDLPPLPPTPMEALLAFKVHAAAGRARQSTIPMQRNPYAGGRTRVKLRPRAAGLQGVRRRGQHWPPLSYRRCVASICVYACDARASHAY